MAVCYAFTELPKIRVTKLLSPSKYLYLYLHAACFQMFLALSAQIFVVHTVYFHIRISLFFICNWSFLFSNIYYTFSNNIFKYACFLLIFPSTTISTEQSSSQSRGTKTTIPYSIIRISGSFFMKGSVYHHNHHKFQKLTAQPSSFAPVQNVNLGGSGWTL